MAIRWAAHRAAGSQAGSDGAAWLAGKAAGAVACDATLIPVVTGQVDPAALDELVGLCLQFAGHGPHCGSPQPAAPAAQPGQTTAQPGQPRNIVSGNNQSAKVSTAFASPLTAIVTDVNGNPVPGVQVTFQVQTPGAASATFAAKGCSSSTKQPVCVVTTKSDGQATTSTFTANSSPGNYTIVATTPVGTNTLSVTFNEANNS